MDRRRGAVWAYRFFLNREPENDDVLRALAESSLSPHEIGLHSVRSAEFRQIMDGAGSVLRLSEDTDWYEGAHWAYAFFTNRDVPSFRIAEAAAARSVNGIRLRTLLDRDIEIFSPHLKPLADFSIVNAFAPFPEHAPDVEAFRDFLGNLTRLHYFGGNLVPNASLVQKSVPRESEPSLHGTAEWVGTLRSVIEASGTLTAIELGAGWAPWLVVANRASAFVGINIVDLTGVEGAEDHYRYMLDNFALNGIDASRHRLLHGVIGVEDGIARFPKLNFAEDYGANAVFDEREVSVAAPRGELEEVSAYSLVTLLSGKSRVDLIHIDIQGHEETVIRSSIDALNRSTRRVVVGTHSRAIEGQLIEIFQSNDWFCEYQVPCRLVHDSRGRLSLIVDGEQVWRNERLKPLGPLLV